MSGKKRKEAGMLTTVEVPVTVNISAIVKPLAKRLAVIEEAHRASKVEIMLLKREVATLHRKNDGLERKLRSHQMAIEALGEDVSWEYSAPDINQNEMFLAGHTVEYIHDAKIIEHHFRDHADEMRSEGFFQQLGEVAIGLSTMSNVVDSVYFQPHWQEFYKGLKLSKGCDMLCFTNVTIPDGAIDLDHLMKSKDILGLFF